ncbi:S-adenosylmethionine decarboxylase family protein [Eisenibacter elegans]|jgi:S-adenosylmethionine decarboxylase|uniref:S-adenosylmethionine decarboxylase family protein n=1 Tax=Eisenibacter elegans TaxID=997 RepID=UPI00041E6204|nr:S-adenosylmethionine decarboxylase [Eisenibacter elegans]
MKAVIYNHHWWISETTPTTLQPLFEKLLLAADFQVLNHMEHHFEPQGYTCIWLLAESHLAIHTFPEEQKSYVELSSCDWGKYEQFLTLLPQYLPRAAILVSQSMSEKS